MRGMRSCLWSSLLVFLSIVTPLCTRMILLVLAGMADLLRMEEQVGMGFLKQR